MAQFDVFRGDGDTLLLDCQSDVLGYLAMRMAVPLIPIGKAPEQRPRLNPIFDVGGERYVMVTQFAAAILQRDLGVRVTNLDRHRLEIIGAFDMLLTGV